MTNDFTENKKNRGEEVDAPITGYKYAHVVVGRDNTKRFSGIAFIGQSRAGYTYTREEEATCIKGGAHEAPARYCDCGYHAVFDKEDLDKLYTPVVTRAILEVELSGTVEVHEEGARGFSQTVLSVTFPSECAVCLSHRTGSAPATQLYKKPLRDTNCYAGICQKHASRFERTTEVLTTTQLATELGVPVRFSTDPPIYKGPGARRRRRDLKLAFAQNAMRFLKAVAPQAIAFSETYAASPICEKDTWRHGQDHARKKAAERAAVFDTLSPKQQTALLNRLPTFTGRWDQLVDEIDPDPSTDNTTDDVS